MIRMILIWAVLFAFTFMGVGTWRKWKLKTAVNWSKIAFQAGLSATIVTLILTGFVLLF